MSSYDLNKVGTEDFQARTAYQSGGAGKVGSASSASNIRRRRNGTARWPLWRYPITKSMSGGNSQ